MRGPKPPETLQHRGHQFRLQRRIVPRPDRRAPLALHDYLRAGIRLGLQQHGVHVGQRLKPARERLQRLGPPDLPPVDGHGGIVRHVLRLERRHRKPPPPRRAAEPRDQKRLADIGTAALDHKPRHARPPSAREQKVREPPAGVFRATMKVDGPFPVMGHPAPGGQNRGSGMLSLWAVIGAPACTALEPCTSVSFIVVKILRGSGGGAPGRALRIRRPSGP